MDISDAVDSGKVGEVLRLLDRGESPRSYHKGGLPLIIYATGLGHIDIVRLLLDRGARICTQDRIGRQSLTIAVMGTHTGIVRLLLDRGANPDIRDNAGCTPLFYAYDGDEETTLLLLDKGASPNIQDTELETPIHRLSYRGQVKTIRLLMKAGADISITNSRGETPLFTAIRSIRSEVVSLLLEEGVDINVGREGDGRTPLMTDCASSISMSIAARVACDEVMSDRRVGDEWRSFTRRLETRRLDIMSLLLEKGALPDKRDSDGWTALMHACSRDDDPLVQLLLDYKANPYLTVGEGVVAYDLASTREVRDILNTYSLSLYSK